MISARSTLSKTYVLTTALSERMLDALALISISAVVLLTMDRKPAWLAVAARPFAAIALGGAIALIVLPRIKDFIERILSRLVENARTPFTELSCPRPPRSVRER